MEIIIQLIIGTGGWWVLHILAVRREIRASWRKFAQEAAKDVESLEDIALTYHQSKSRDILAEETIFKYLNRLENKLYILDTHLEDINLRTFNSLKAAITAHNFQTQNFKPQTSKSLILKSIMAWSSHLIGELYQAH